MKKKSKSKTNKKLWQDLSELLRGAREVSGCEICGKTTSLQCHHVCCSKYYAKSILRFAPENILVCCGKHHFMAHKSPAQMMEWFQRYREDDWRKCLDILGKIR